MAKVYKGDLNVDSAVSMLNRDCEDCDALISKLTVFENAVGSGRLVEGPAFELAKDHISKLKNIVEKRKQVAKQFAVACTNAVTSMSNYMEGYNYLSDEELDMIESQISSIETQISQYYYKLNQMKKGKFVQPNPLTNPTYLQGELDSLYQKAEKLRGLQPADSEAYSILKESIKNSEDYGASIDSVL